MHFYSTCSLFFNTSYLKDFNSLHDHRNAYAFTYGTLGCWSSGSRNTIFYNGTNRHIFPRIDVQVLDTKHWICSPNYIDGQGGCVSFGRWITIVCHTQCTLKCQRVSLRGQVILKWMHVLSSISKIYKIGQTHNKSIKRKNNCLVVFSMTKYL